MHRASAAQVLFDRIFRTWVSPEIERRAPADPIVLGMVLIVWEGKGEPRVFINDEVRRLVEKADIVLARPVTANQDASPEDIAGVGRFKTSRDLWGKTCLFIILGKSSKYFLRANRYKLLPSAGEFRKLERQLATEGVLLKSGAVTMPVQLDLVRNSYVGSPSQKRRLVISLREHLLQQVTSDATLCVKRHLRLPAYIAHIDNDVMPLLEESRQAYIDGLYFSCIAASTTTADRICNGLLERYCVDPRLVRRLLTSTFGQKIQELRSLSLISEEQEGVMRSLNAVRNRYLHPKRIPSKRAVPKDALRAVTLLHRIIDDTESVFRDYTMKDGMLVPRPLT